MLYCSDCDKDVEFKSLDVGGKLTHFCSDCGETNLFKGKEEYEEVGKLLERKTGKRKERNRLILYIGGFLLLIGFMMVASENYNHDKEEREYQARNDQRLLDIEQKQREWDAKKERQSSNPAVRSRYISTLKPGDVVDLKLRLNPTIYNMFEIRFMDENFIYGNEMFTKSWVANLRAGIETKYAKNQIEWILRQTGYEN